MTKALEELGRIAVDCGYHLHEELGPGLLESVYEACLYQSLAQRGLYVERQKAVPILFNGIALDEGFRVDILVERQLLIELKSTEAHAQVHEAGIDLPAIDETSTRLSDEFRRGDVQGRHSPSRQQLLSPVE